MSSSINNKSLLRSLRKLYCSITMIYMKSLARFNREHVAAGVPMCIMSSLSESIEKVAANAVTETGDAASSPPRAPGNIEVHTPAPLMPASAPGTEAEKLSMFFRNTHRHSAVSLDAGDRLMQHTWDHIHAAIRIAHQGDVNTARLHVELASSGFKEASHYLSPPVYASFAHDVTKALNELNAQHTMDKA
jgi:hypothetical protein